MECVHEQDEPPESSERSSRWGTSLAAPPTASVTARFNALELSMWGYATLQSYPASWTAWMTAHTSLSAARRMSSPQDMKVCLRVENTRPSSGLCRRRRKSLLRLSGCRL